MRIEQAAHFPRRAPRAQWAGLRNYVADSLAAVGLDAEVPGFFWLVGQGGYRIRTSPALGRVPPTHWPRRNVPEDLQSLGVRAGWPVPARLHFRAGRYRELEDRHQSADLVANRQGAMRRRQDRSVMSAAFVASHSAARETHSPPRADRSSSARPSRRAGSSPPTTPDPARAAEMAIEDLNAKGGVGPAAQDDVPRHQKRYRRRRRCCARNCSMPARRSPL